jgi:ParB/Sulfiredoxin domain
MGNVKGKKAVRRDGAHRKMSPRRAKRPKIGSCPNFAVVPLSRLTPAELNDRIYKPVQSTDTGMAELAESIRQDGLKQRIVTTRDFVFLSGHRRRVASEIAGLTEVPVEIEDIDSTDSDFPRLLVTYNTGQRDKTAGERVREKLVTSVQDPNAAYQSLMKGRVEASRVKTAPLVLGETKRRAEISPAKAGFLAAVRQVIWDLRDYWPLSDRRIHYALLNNPPLIHASKPASKYRNDVISYKALTDLLTRARLTRQIPFIAIGDETRPVTIWTVYPNVGPFVEQEVRAF